MTNHMLLKSDQTLKRRPHRGIYYQPVVHSIPDEAFMCMASSAHEGSPMAYADDVLEGRLEDVRAPSDKELDNVTVMRIPIVDAVAKIRSSPRMDFGTDRGRDCLDGEVPIKQVVAELIPDPRGRHGVVVPDYVSGFEKLPEAANRMASNMVDEL